jgi:hypothetical protein
LLNGHQSVYGILLIYLFCSSRAGYHGRMQQIMQMEKDRHAEFLRQFNIEQVYSGGAELAVKQVYVY